MHDPTELRRLADALEKYDAMTMYESPAQYTVRSNNTIRRALAAGLRSLAEVQPIPEQDAKDALRYRWLRGRTTCDLNQRFLLPVVEKVRGSNLLRGSIAGHLDSAIDAAIAKEPT